MNNLLNFFTTPQLVILGIAAAAFVVLLGLLLYFLYVLIFKPDIKAEIRAMDELFKVERKSIEAEKEFNEAELKRSAKQIDEKAKRTQKLESENERMQIELMEQGIQEELAAEIAEMTLEQLFDLKNKEERDVSDAFIINAITRKVLIDSNFEKRADVEDFKVPLNKTPAVTGELEKYILSLNDVAHSHEDDGKRLTSYKIYKKAFALISHQEDGKFKLTLKCGPFYGQRLTQLYPEFFGRAKFPYGMIWFTADNIEDGCSMELMKLVVYISYTIAKAGY
ncbi:MAG: hypothetical protein FWD39_05725 [Clostridiales bacterium]|nr:hypothetical protein [Clostridiales bacterium]